MVILNGLIRRQINFKVVYCGPPGAGVSANLTSLEDYAPSELVSIDTEECSVLFLDGLPLSPERRIGGLKVSSQLFAAPGEVSPEAIRRLALFQGVDGVVFVATSDPTRTKDNQRALGKLLASLDACGLDPATLPVVLQWNQRDLQDALGPRERAAFNEFGWPELEAVASGGEGVRETLGEIQELMTRRLEEGYGIERPEKDRSQLPLASPTASQRDPPPAPDPPPRSGGNPPEDARSALDRPLIRPAPPASRVELGLGLFLCLLALGLAAWNLL